MNMMMDIGALLAGIFIGLCMGALGGFTAGTLYSFRQIRNFFLADPDGPGGWRNRIEQLGQRHKGNNHVK